VVGDLDAHAKHTLLGAVVCDVEVPASAGCGHEKWLFAPGRGLVKMRQNSGSGIDGDEDPKITMVRMR
jgi:hypothetical protein